MQSKLRTNGAFLRNFDSKRYQELQQQKEQILRKQLELEKIKQKGKHMEKGKGKVKTKVNIKSAEAFDYVRSESDRSDPEKIKRNSFYPSKTKSKGDNVSIKAEEMEIKQMDCEKKVNMQEPLASIKENPDSQNTLIKEKDNMFPQLDGLNNLADGSNNPKKNMITVVATIEPVRYNVGEPSLAEVIEEDSSEIRRAINNTDVESIDSGLSSDKKIESDDCETIRNGLEHDSDKLFIDNGGECLNQEGNDKFDNTGNELKVPDLPAKKHRRKFRTPKFEMDVSTSSAEFDSELFLESGIVYDPKRLIITEEQLSSLYITSSSSG